MVKEALIRLNPEIAEAPERADEVLYKLRAMMVSVQPHNLVTQNEETNIDLTQFKTENIQEINQAPISNQFNIEEYQATTKTDTTEFNGEFLNTFDSNPIVQPIETQNIEQNIDIKTEEYVPTSFDNTQTVETQNIEPNIDMKTEEYTPTSYDNTFQQPIEMQQNIEQKVDIKAEEFVPTSYDNTQIFETQNTNMK